MDQILQHVCSIENHPVSILDERVRQIYLKGLGASLFAISKNDPTCKMMFSVWANSICNRVVDIEYYWKDNPSSIKKAMSPLRYHWRIISLKYELVFDSFYLFTSSKPEHDVSAASRLVYNYFGDGICNIFTQRAFETIGRYFLNGKYSKKIDESLLKHKQINESFLTKPQKRILVVANISAGKSTLINAMVGHKLNKARTSICTNRLVQIENKPFRDGITTLTDAGEYGYTNNVELVSSGDFRKAAIQFNSLLSDSNICFIDTPGINNAIESGHKEITTEAVKQGNYDLVIYISNGKYFGTYDEYSLLKLLKANVTKPILFVLNQLDEFIPEDDSVDKMINDYFNDLKKIGFDNPCVIPVSAYASFLFKTAESNLNQTEVKRIKSLKDRFDSEYYDLPSYITGRKSNDYLTRTGITILEQTIKKSLNIS